jgi:hypothetical protein
MSKMRAAGFSMSVDGFGAGPNQRLQEPLGQRGPELFNWFFRPRLSAPCTAKVKGRRASTMTTRRGR